jgi:hypothetical protein
MLKVAAHMGLPLQEATAAAAAARRILPPERKQQLSMCIYACQCTVAQLTLHLA